MCLLCLRAPIDDKVSSAITDDSDWPRCSASSRARRWTAGGRSVVVRTPAS